MITPQRPFLAIASITGLVLLLAACSAGPTVKGPDADVAAARLPSPEYRIGPGDMLGVFVYRAPDLSESSIPVRPDGRISIPLVPDVMAAGLTPTALGDALQRRLAQYVKDPIVTVIVTGFVGPFDRQIRVIGEATDPMAIPYRDHMTLLDVMIATKGLTRYAAGNSAKIIRRDGDSERVIPVHLSDLLKDGDIGANVPMRPGDTLIIPQSWF